MVKTVTRTSWRPRLPWASTWHGIEIRVTVFSCILHPWFSHQCLPAPLRLLLLSFSPTRWQEDPSMTNCVLFFLDPPDSFPAEWLLCFPGDAPPSPVCRAWHMPTSMCTHVHALRLGDSCYCDTQPQGSKSKMAQGITRPTACRKEERETYWQAFNGFWAEIPLPRT